MQKNVGIQSTKNYDMFKNIKGNRNLVLHHLAQLTVSILENNMLDVNPIIVNEKMEVIDGQHRLEIAKNNKLEIYYIVLPAASIQNTIKLNAHTKVWTLTDYINSYAILGNDHYQWLAQFIQNHSMAPSNAINITTGSKAGGSVIGMVKHGNLEIVEAQRKRAEERAEMFEEVRKYVNRSNSIPRSITRAIIILHKEGLGKKLIKGLQESETVFTPKTDIYGAEAQLRRFAAEG